MKVIIKPQVMEATQWYKQGDHPDVTVWMTTPEEENDSCWRGCGKPMQEHGCVTNTGDMVCPGDWIIKAPLYNAVDVSNNDFNNYYIKVADLDMSQKDMVVEKNDSQSYLWDATMYNIETQVLGSIAKQLRGVKKS